MTGGKPPIFCCDLVSGLYLSVLKSLVLHQVKVQVDVFEDLVHRRRTVDGKQRNWNYLYRTQFGRDTAITIGSDSPNIRVVDYMYSMWVHIRGSFIVDLGHGTCWDRGIRICAARGSLFMAN